MNYKNLLLVSAVISLLLFSMCSTKKKRIIFFGDSITQMGAEPGGYIDVMNKMLEVQDKAKDIELAGSGISGNKIYDLYLRVEEDVLAKQPDVVVIWIGVNDVWHKALIGTGTDADKFEKFYTALIKKLQDENIETVLCTPAVIGEKYDITNPQDKDLNDYSEIIRILAANNKCGLCDLRKLFLDYEKKHNTTNIQAGILTTDGVHLNAEGNKFVAASMMEVLMK